MPLRYICKKCSFPGRLYIPRDQDVRGGVLVLHGSEGGGRSFAGFRWCTAQTVALYFTLSGVGNFRSGSAGLELIERQPASPLPRSGLDHCERSRLPTRAFSQQHATRSAIGFSLALSQAIPEPPLPAALVR